MIQHKPAFEAIEPTFGHSFTYVKFDQDRLNQNNRWHYHPEIELVYVNGGSGKRQIGSHVSCYSDGDLILVGSNLPHCGFTDKLTGNKSETVVQMKFDFLGNDFFGIPEMKKIQNLFENSKGGIAFHGEIKQKIGAEMELLEHRAKVASAGTPINRSAARKFLIDRLSFLAKRYGFTYNRVFIRNQKTRWGSCSTKNNINLNVNLVRLPNELIDYTILHELVHTRVKNHSQRFWDQMDLLLGDAKKVDKKLSAYEFLLI